MSVTVAPEGQRPAPDGVGGAGREAAQRPTLGTHRGELFPRRSEAYRERRDERLRQRRWLWLHSVRERTRDCGRKSRTEGGPVLRMTGDGDDRRMGVAGLVTCGSQTCPCCAAKIGAHRANEIADTLRQHRADHWHPELGIGGGAILVTLTLRHHAGMGLAFLLVVLRYGWSRVTSGKAYLAEQTRSGVVGWIASLEINWSRLNWWHPHLHILVLTDVPLSPEHARDLGERWFLRWERALGRKGVQTIMDSGGLDVRVCDLSDPSTGALGDYLSKVARETTASYAKEGRDGSFSVFGLLREVISTYEVQAFEAWQELERTVSGRRIRFLTWSKGALEVRARATGREEEISNEEIAAKDMGGDNLIVIEPEDWPKLRLVLEVLFGVGERDGLHAAAAWLTRHGIGWSWAEAAPDLPRPPRPPQRAPRPSRPPGRARSRRRGQRT